MGENENSNAKQIREQDEHVKIFVQGPHSFAVMWETHGLAHAKVVHDFTTCESNEVGDDLGNPEARRRPDGIRAADRLSEGRRTHC